MPSNQYFKGQFVLTIFYDAMQKQGLKQAGGIVMINSDIRNIVSKLKLLHKFDLGDWVLHIHNLSNHQ